MTEAEWLAATDPTQMLEFCRENVSARKVRLFAAASCRSIWHLLKDERSKLAVEMTERNADGLLTDEALQTVRQAPPCPYPPDEACDADPTHEYNTVNAAAVVSAYGMASAACAAAYAANPLAAPFQLADGASGFMYNPIATAEFAVDAFAAISAAIAIKPLVDSAEYKEANILAEVTNATASQQEKKHQCEIVKCIFGNPFQPVTAEPSWFTSTVLAIAKAIYAERAFDRMPTLADALEEARCDNADILNHCRQPGEHVRGCWVVDLLTGRK